MRQKEDSISGCGVLDSQARIAKDKEDVLFRQLFEPQRREAHKKTGEIELSIETGIMLKSRVFVELNPLSPPFQSCPVRKDTNLSTRGKPGLQGILIASCIS